MVARWGFLLVEPVSYTFSLLIVDDAADVFCNICICIYLLYANTANRRNGTFFDMLYSFGENMCVCSMSSELCIFM